MARKVLISFLGTGNYTPVFYSWKGKNTTAHPTKFIQEAIAKWLCKGWTEKDCIMVFRTRESNRKNWLDSKSKDGLDVKGLDATFQEMSELKPRVNPEKVASDDTYMIPAGFNEQQTEDIFKIVFDKLEKDDEIYFDMTHAFRSIPIFASALFNYARFLKHVNIKGIYYGAFEALLPENGEKLTQEMIEGKSAPIVDMTNTVLLQDLTTAAASFSKTGNLSSFSDILADKVDEGLDNSVDDMILALRDLDLYIQTSNIIGIKTGEYMATICNRIEAFCNSPFTTDPQRKMVREIQIALTEYGFQAKDGYFNVEAAIAWAINHRMIQQAYTMAKEYVISRVFDILEEENLVKALQKELIANGKTINDENRMYELRTAISQIIKCIYDTGRYYKMNYKKFWGHSNTAKTLLNSHQSIGNLKKPYEVIADSRNILAHAATTDENGYNFNDYIEEFNSHWDECLEALDSLK